MKIAALFIGILVLGFAPGALAGNLTPPAGPVAATQKALTEVEPRTAVNPANTPGDADSLFRIAAPGSYYLTGNITGVVGKHGIEIVVSGVTVDLMGFALTGIPGSLDGVSVTVGALDSIVVRDGIVRAWGDDGVDLFTSGVVNCSVVNVTASGNTDTGILTGESSRIHACASHANSQHGILTGGGNRVTECVAQLNTVNGILVGNGSLVSGCVSYDNTVAGIVAFSGATVADSTAYSNGGFGISVSNGCSVNRCTVRFNNGNGIAVLSACIVSGNACTSNGNGASDGANIHATGNDNRIEGNNCFSADRGIDVDMAGNIIIRNTCSDHLTNWDVAAGNVCLVVQGVAGAAILGNTGGVAPGSTDPNANFTY